MAGRRRPPGRRQRLRLRRHQRPRRARRPRRLGRDRATDRAHPFRCRDLSRRPAGSTTPERVEGPVLLLQGRDAAELLAQLDAWEADPTSVPAAVGAAARPGSRSWPPTPAASPWPARCSSGASRGGAATTSGSSPRACSPPAGKLAFLFPGVEPTFEPRVDDVVDALRPAVRLAARRRPRPRAAGARPHRRGPVPPRGARRPRACGPTPSPATASGSGAARWRPASSPTRCSTPSSTACSPARSR